MNSELEILKKIWENKEESNVKLLSRQTGLGMDYIRYLSNYLFKKGQIRPVKNKHNWYKITSRGKAELKLRGLIKLKKKKPTYQPKNLGWSTLKLREFPRKTKSFSKKIKLISSPPGFQEKMKISKEVERAVVSLEKIKS